MTAEESAEMLRQLYSYQVKFILDPQVEPGTLIITPWAAPTPPTCECGAAKCKTTHSAWCPVYAP